MLAGKDIVMDTILSSLLTRASTFLHRAVTYVKSPGPSGFEYLAGVVLHARLEATQRELAKQDELLAETVAECDAAVARSAALSRETIGLLLQIDELRQQVPDQDVLQQTREALEASNSTLARQDELLAVTADERDGAVAQVSALSRETNELRETLEARDRQVANLTAALTQSELRAATAERERDRLQGALTRAEGANRVATDPAATTPVPVDGPGLAATGTVALAVARPSAPAGATARRGTTRKDARHRETAPH